MGRFWLYLCFFLGFWIPSYLLSGSLPWPLDCILILCFLVRLGNFDDRRACFGLDSWTGQQERCLYILRHEMALQRIHFYDFDHFSTGNPRSLIIMNRWDLLTLGLVEQLFQSSSSTRNIDRTLLQVGLFPDRIYFQAGHFPRTS